MGRAVVGEGLGKGIRTRPLFQPQSLSSWRFSSLVPFSNSAALLQSLNHELQGLGRVSDAAKVRAGKNASNIEVKHYETRLVCLSSLQVPLFEVWADFRLRYKLTFWTGHLKQIQLIQVSLLCFISIFDAYNHYSTGCAKRLFHNSVLYCIPLEVAICFLLESKLQWGPSGTLVHVFSLMGTFNFLFECKQNVSRGMRAQSTDWLLSQYTSLRLYFVNHVFISTSCV